MPSFTRAVPEPYRCGLRLVVAGTTAATLSGLPSTVHALATGGDLLASTRAAGTLLPFRANRPGVAAGVAAHVTVSATWFTVLAAVNRRRKLGLAGGCTAGLLIAALDLEIAGRRYPAIRALPRLPQWLDHVAFGAVAGTLLGEFAGERRGPGRGSRRWPALRNRRSS